MPYTIEIRPISTGRFLRVTKDEIMTAAPLIRPAAPTPKTARPTIRVSLSPLTLATWLSPRVMAGMLSRGPSLGRTGLLGGRRKKKGNYRTTTFKYLLKVEPGRVRRGNKRTCSCNEVEADNPNQQPTDGELKMPAYLMPLTNGASAFRCWRTANCPLVPSMDISPPLPLPFQPSTTIPSLQLFAFRQVQSVQKWPPN
jgi:hypothetical protein